MQDIKSFATSGRALAKNPLGIIALFIVLVYAFAALTLAAGTNLQPFERTALVLFLVVFPVIVLAVFCWLVIGHHEKLYAPADYKSDEGFLAGLRERDKRAKEFEQQQTELRTTLRRTVVESGRGIGASREQAEQLADKIADDVVQATTLTIDARSFLGDPSAIRVYPTSAFTTLGWLVEEALLMLEPAVQPFEYGYTWQLRDKSTGKVVEHARLITKTPRGTPIDDHRSLLSAGIRAGTTLVVEHPPQSAV